MIRGLRMITLLKPINGWDEVSGYGVGVIKWVWGGGK